MFLLVFFDAVLYVLEDAKNGAACEEREEKDDPRGGSERCEEAKNVQGATLAEEVLVVSDEAVRHEKTGVAKPAPSLTRSSVMRNASTQISIDPFVMRSTALFHDGMPVPQAISWR